MKKLSTHAVAIAVAAVGALVLSIWRPSPASLVGGLGPQEVRAAPGQPVQVAQHRLTDMVLVNRTLTDVRKNYVDPSRIDSKKMLFRALDSVQFRVAEILIEPAPERDEVTVMVGAKRQTFSTKDVDSPWRLAASLKPIFKFIEDNVSKTEDLAEVEYAAVNGMLSALDPHSVLFDPEEAKDFEVNTRGKFGGLGIVIRLVNSKLTVIRPMRDTPAGRAGIKAGDHIVKINQEPTENLTSDESVERMRGTPKTKVTLWIARKGMTDLLRFDLERAVIRVESVQSKLVSGNVGLIRIDQFSDNTGAEVANAMTTLMAQGATAWVLDMRRNPGGVLDASIEVADLFLRSGVIVSTMTSGTNARHTYAESDNEDATSSLAVLINSSSASAAEIVAGAIKNNNRGIIIGGRSFGKGSVQKLYSYRDGSQLKLTIEQYLTPGEKSIQSVGIVPDIELLRTLVPSKNDAPGDVVRLLPSSRSYRERDLDSHLDSSFAKDTETPQYSLAYLFERPATPAALKPVEGEAPIDGEEEEELITDELQTDFEILFAAEIVKKTKSPSREVLLRSAAAIVAAKQADEAAKRVKALAKLGIDWAAPPAASARTKTSLRLDVAVTPGAELVAGDTALVTAKLTNTGTAPAYRAFVRTLTDDPIFRDYELAFGKVMPGETKTFTTRVKIPSFASDRRDHIQWSASDAAGSAFDAPPLALGIKAAPQPAFGYAYQMVDGDGADGDGLVQAGERIKLRVAVKNAGVGAAPKAVLVLRNSSGDDVVLETSRLQMGAVAAGTTREHEFTLRIAQRPARDFIGLEMTVYDETLGTSASEKLRFEIKPAIAKASEARGVEQVKAKATVYAGADVSAGTIGTLEAASQVERVAQYGDWVKVARGAGKHGFVRRGDLAAGSGAAAPKFETRWQVIPPIIELAPAALAVSSGTFTVKGVVKDDNHVEDVYIYVTNDAAKIETRKVFYASSRDRGSRTALEFSANVTLWPGSNEIVIVARENEQVTSMRQFYVYRDGGAPVAATLVPQP
ncbi:MAG: PDZ domain-containing protein [Myxococcales bacterium]|nr:PDZ domain-containing protein [Myxococcales bacterium]